MLSFKPASSLCSFTLMNRLFNYLFSVIRVVSSAYLLFLILIFTLFCFTIWYWFCHTLTWISHRCTWFPNPEPPSHLPPHIISLDHPRATAPSILYPVSNIDWWFVSYMIVYMFQCHSPKSSHPLPLPQSWTMVLEKTLESPLDCKEIQLVHPKGNQSWIFIGSTMLKV